MKTKLISLAVLAAFSFSAISATTDDLKLKGKVPKKLEILVTPESIATDLDLEASPTALLVASVNEKSNSNTGYKITADSLNDGLLVNQQDTTQSVAYTMTYDTNLVDLSVANDVVKTITASGVHDNNSDVNIAYTGAPHASRVEGTYTDTVTFTISAN